MNAPTMKVAVGNASLSRAAYGSMPPHLSCSDDRWWGRRESNPHAFWAGDFESPVSAGSTTSPVGRGLVPPSRNERKGSWPTKNSDETSARDRSHRLAWFLTHGGVAILVHQTDRRRTGGGMAWVLRRRRFRLKNYKL